MTDENTESGGDRTHQQKPFIGLNTYQGRRYEQIGAINASFKEYERTRGVIGGMFRHVEGTGKFNKSVILLNIGRNARDYIRDSDKLKQVFRRIRQQEAQQLDKLDAAIKAAELVVNDLRKDRGELVKLAFQKGHTVYLNEVREVAEANLAARKTEYQALTEEQRQKEEA